MRFQLGPGSQLKNSTAQFTVPDVVLLGRTGNTVFLASGLLTGTKGMILFLCEFLKNPNVSLMYFISCFCSCNVKDTFLIKVIIYIFNIFTKTVVLHSISSIIQIL